MGGGRTTYRCFAFWLIMNNIYRLAHACSDCQALLYLGVRCCQAFWITVKTNCFFWISTLLITHWTSMLFCWAAHHDWVSMHPEPKGLAQVVLQGLQEGTHSRAPLSGWNGGNHSRAPYGDQRREKHSRVTVTGWEDSQHSRALNL